MRRSLLLALVLALPLLTAACDKPADKAARAIERGNALFEREDYAKARLEYKNAARAAPTDAQVFYRLGLVDEAEGSFQDAFANFIHAEEQNAQYVPALLKLAQYFMAGDQHEQATGRLNAVFAIEKDNAQAYALSGAVKLRLKDFDAAEKDALRAQALEPANITAISVLTGLYTAKGDHAKAASTLEAGLAANPQNVSILLLKAAFYEKTNDLAKTEESYAAVFKLKPKELRYRLALVSVYVKAGKTQEAEAALRACETAFPERWEVKRALVDFLAKTRGMEAAEKEAQAYLQKHPNRSEPYFWLADLYSANKDIDRAANLLSSIIAKDEGGGPDTLNARASLARLHILKGDRSLAQKLVSTILDKNAGHSDALLIRARLSFEDGNLQGAVTDLRAIIRDTPNVKEAYPVLGEVLLAQGRLDLAIDTLAQMLERYPQDVPTRIRLAQMYEAAGNPRQGLEHLALALKLAPTHPIAWESVARLAITAQTWTQADDAIAKLESLDGQGRTASFLKGKKHAAQGQATEALALYKTVIDTAPLTPLADHALTAAVTLCEKDKRYEEALALIESLPQKSPAALNAFGEVLLRAGKPQEKAIVAFDAAIAAGTMEAKPYLNRAALFAREGLFDEALAVLKKAQSLSVSDYALDLMVASLLGKQGKHAEEIATYEALLARNPDLHVAANNMAQTIADAKPDDAAALEKARLVAERFISSPNPVLLDTLAWVYYRQGKYDQALTIMERAMAMNAPKLPAQMHYHHGALLAKMGLKDRAKEALGKAVNSGESFVGDQEAKTLLKGL